MPDDQNQGGQGDQNQGDQNQGDQNQGNQGGESKWYSTLEGDLATNPTIQKFESPTHLARSYVEAQNMLGGEKIINPFKMAEDKRASGMAKYNEAIGVPKTPSEYAFTDPNDVPEGLAFDKSKFGEVAHRHSLRPEQAEGIWKEYTGDFIGGYKQQKEAHQASLNAAETALRQEWGDTYDSNVSLASKFVRHKIKDDAEFEALNAEVSSNPKLIKLFASYGKDFSENKISGFKDPGSSKLTPQQAQEQYDSIVGNMSDDYYSDTNSIRQRRIDHVHSLVEMGANPMKSA